MATNQRVARKVQAARRVAAPQPVKSGTCINVWVSDRFKWDVKHRAADLHLNASDYIRGLINEDFAKSGGIYEPETIGEKLIRGQASEAEGNTAEG